MTDLPDLKALREAAEKWKAATKIWSLDPATDAIATMKIGENMLFAGIDYIATLQNFAAAQGARITALEEGLEPFAKLYGEHLVYPDLPPPPDERNAWGFNNTDLKWGDFHRASTLLKDD